MKMCPLVLLAISCALTIDNLEATSTITTRMWIGNTVHWVRDHCGFSVGFPFFVGVNCSFRRGKRDAALTAPSLPSADGVLSASLGLTQRSFEAQGIGNAAHGEDVFNCSSLSLRQNMIPKLVFDVAFLELDADEDGLLNDLEFAQYQGVVQIIASCINDDKAHQ